jgi:hypothetical protein
MSGRSPGPQVSVVSALRALATIFPHQHPRTSAWLAALGELGGDPLGTAPSPGSRGAQERVRKAPQRPAAPEDSGHGPSQTRPPAKVVGPPAVPALPPPPAHARLLQGSLRDWSERQKGLQLSYVKEKDLRAEIRRRADIATGGEGYNEAMLAIGYDLDCGRGRLASVEIVAPRVQDVASVLVGAGPKGSPKQYFELDFNRLSAATVRDIGEYVLDLTRP